SGCALCWGGEGADGSGGERVRGVHGVGDREWCDSEPGEPGRRDGGATSSVEPAGRVCPDVFMEPGRPEIYGRPGDVWAAVRLGADDDDGACAGERARGDSRVGSWRARAEPKAVPAGGRRGFVPSGGAELERDAESYGGRAGVWRWGGCRAAASCRDSGAVSRKCVQRAAVVDGVLVDEGVF